MIYIENIFISDYLSLKDFKWENVPSFSIITGINGAGKTQLLEAIRAKIATLGVINPTGDNVNNLIQYIPYNHTFAPFDESRGTIANVQNRKTSFLQFVKSYQKPNSTWNQDFYNLCQELEKLTQKSIQSMDEEEILDLLSFDYVNWYTNSFDNQFISEIFKTYEQQEAKLKLEYLEYDKEIKIKREDIISKIGLPPWKIINELFNKYGFHYNIIEPVLDLTYIPTFKSKNSNSSIYFQQLSSGEKLIVNLILWAYNKNLGRKNKILLLDEFDAHLNPSLSKMLVEIIRDKIVNEFGIQVFMTTHSPSTVAYAKEEELFWMEREKGIKRSSKAEIIPILSDGIISVNEDIASLALDYKIKFNSEEKPILLVEGITDKIILEQAWSILYPNISIPICICDFFDCYALINLFIRGDIFNNYPDKHFIGLLDFDDAYKTWKEKAKDYRTINIKAYDGKKSLCYSHKTQKGNILILPVPTHRQEYAGIDIEDSKLSIELLFEDDIIQKYCDKRKLPGGIELHKFKDNKKVEFANSIQKVNDENVFISFKPIFEAIDEIIAQQKLNNIKQELPTSIK